MRDEEYDRFGPWILEITEADPIPMVFTPYVSDSEKPLLALKVPRPMERRNLSPGDYMYDYLVSLYDDRIVILARREGEADRFSLKYVDILALKNGEDLLDGHLIIYGPGMAYDLPYSTVSVELIRRVIMIIRERYTPPAEIANENSPFAKKIPDPDRSRLSFLFS